MGVCSAKLSIRVQPLTTPPLLQTNQTKFTGMDSEVGEAHTSLAPTDSEGDSRVFPPQVIHSAPPHFYSSHHESDHETETQCRKTVAKWKADLHLTL